MKPQRTHTSTSRLFRLVILIATIAFGSTVAWAQTDTLRLDTDGLFLLAREKAFQGQREEARRLCTAILDRSPDYTDARVLLGRTYAWDGQWDNARRELEAVLNAHPANVDALAALVDVELWSEKYERALDLAEGGLWAQPNSEDLLMRKVRALKGLGRSEEALHSLNALEDLNPSLGEIASLRSSIQSASMKNSVTVSYATDRFSDIFDPMQYSYFQIGRRTLFGPFFIRVNYNSRFSSHGWQYEADFYPRLADGIYAYLNYGYSVSDLFPQHRAGAEVYTKLPSSFEGSAGFRYLSFASSSSVTIYTGSLGLYFGSYWISFRPYFIPGDAGLSTSASLTLRRYFGDPENFLSLRAGAGFSADERFIQSSSGFVGKDVFYLKSQSFGVGWQQNFGARYLVVATLDVTNQELGSDPGNYVTMYSASLGFRVRF